MGTRADFYVGKHDTAEWLGSIAWDGYRDGIPDPILEAKDEATYRTLVVEFIANRRDGTKPEQGWPWPWDDSATSDCSYWFFAGEVWDALRDTYQRCSVPAPETDEDCEKMTTDGEAISYPNMSAIKAVTLGDRSGVIVIRG